MLRVLRVHWTAVDDGQWSVLQARLTTKQLAPHGCMSCHIRREGQEVSVTALWDGSHGVQRFVRWHLADAVRAAGLSEPEVSTSRLDGMYTTQQRPAA